MHAHARVRAPFGEDQGFHRPVQYLPKSWNMETALAVPAFCRFGVWEGNGCCNLLHTVV